MFVTVNHQNSVGLFIRNASCHFRWLFSWNKEGKLYCCFLMFLKILIYTFYPEPHINIEPSEGFNSKQCNVKSIHSSDETRLAPPTYSLLCPTFSSLLRHQNWNSPDKKVMKIMKMFTCEWIFLIKLILGTAYVSTL